MTHDVVIIGGGHNGLVAAFYLAKGRLQAARPRAARRSSAAAPRPKRFAPGYRCPTLAHAHRAAAAVDRPRHAAGTARRRVRPARTRGSSRCRRRTRAGVLDRSRADGRSDPAVLGEGRGAVPGVLRDARAARRVPLPTARDDAAVDRRAGGGRAVGAAEDRTAVPRARKKDAFALLRWGPMAVADLVAEWFETDLLQAAVAARGDFRHGAGTVVGRHRRGAAAERGDRSGARRQQRHGQGRSRRAVARRWRMPRARPAPRSAPVRRSPQILVKDGAAAGVAARRRHRRSPPRTSSPSADPRRTLLGLVDPVELEPLHDADPQLPHAGHGGEGEPRAARPAGVRGRRQRPPTCTAGVHIGPGIDYLERAFDASKYGEISAEPYLDITFRRCTIRRWRRPAGTSCRSTSQFAPYKLRRACRLAHGAGRSSRHRAPHARALRAGHLERSSSTGRSSRRSISSRTLRSHRRPHPSRRAGARSALHDAADARLGAVPHADRGAVPLRRGHAPGRRHHRRVRTERRARNHQGAEIVAPAPCATLHARSRLRWWLRHASSRSRRATYPSASHDRPRASSWRSRSDSVRCPIERASVRPTAS